MKRIAVLLALTACASSAAAFSACGGDDEAASAADSGAGNDVGISSSSSGSSSSGGTGDGGTATCAAYAEASCNRQARCNPLFIDLLYGTVEACKEGWAIICDRMTRAPGAAPITAACIDGFATACGGNEYALACVTKGSLADGTPCEFDTQCASGRCGSAGGTPGCGLCKAAPDASSNGYTQQGGSCTNEGTCQPGLACLDASSSAGMPINGTCEKKRELGEACFDAEDCNTGFYDDLGWTGFTVACLDGGCAKPLDENATCSGQPAHSCDLQKKLGCSSGTCTQVAFKKVNEPCTQNTGVTPSGNCSGDLLCIGDAGANGGTCTPRPGVGQPCVKDFECRFGMECDNGKCTIRPADFCK